MLDDPKFCTIVDRSGWPVERVINLHARVGFINQILMEELFDKRLPALNSFKEGLDHFGLLSMIKQNPRPVEAYVFKATEGWNSWPHDC